MKNKERKKEKYQVKLLAVNKIADYVNADNK